jgi:hypothetical protein
MFPFRLRRRRERTMRYLILAAMSCLLVGCGSGSLTPTPTSSVDLPPLQISVPPPAAGAYTLQIDVDERCALPPAAKERTYDVTLTTQVGYAYVAVRSVNPSLVGDLWFGSRGGIGGVIFRWNGTDNGYTSCGSPETIGSTAFCLYGEGPWSAATDGTISGVLNGGVDFGEQHCLNESHRFVLRSKT